MNESIEFGSCDFYVNESDLHDFAWSVNSKNNKISGFSRGIITKTIPVIIMCKNETDGIKARNKLFEIAEKDVLSNMHGKLVVGDYYLKCFITQAQSTDYLFNKSFIKVKLKITTDRPFWIKETTSMFLSGATHQGKNMDYNREFPYDYTTTMHIKTLNNTNFVASNFKLSIFGACESPCVTINGHDYSVNASVQENEILEISSLEKTVVLKRKNGSAENLFNSRNRDSYIFEKIPPGELSVSSNEDFSFSILVYEERSEPKWI